MYTVQLNVQHPRFANSDSVVVIVAFCGHHHGIIAQDAEYFTATQNTCSSVIRPKSSLSPDAQETTCRS